MSIHVTEEQRIKLINLQRASHSRLVFDQMCCVLLYATGRATEMIAHAQFIHETTVGCHLNDWLNGCTVTVSVTESLWEEIFPHKCTAEDQRAFVETYNELKQKTGDDEPILFIDSPSNTGNKLAYACDAQQGKSSASRNYRQSYRF